MRDDIGKDFQPQRFWNAYAKSAGVEEGTFSVLRFGDSDELADELAILVVSGTKRAHASLPRDFAVQQRPVPNPGDFGVLLDGKRIPCCIIRFVQVEIKPMHEVDARFAWDTGGGNRSLEWWMSAHTRYFKRQGAREGFFVDGSTDVVLERFEVVWPLEIADVKPAH